MNDTPKSFVGKSREIRKLCEQVLEIGPGSQEGDFERIKAIAKALLSDTPRKRGNPDILDAVQASVKSRRDTAAIHHAVVHEAIRNARAAGAKTYPQIAKALNDKLIFPFKAERWTPGLARAFDPDRIKK